VSQASTRPEHCLTAPFAVVDGELVIGGLPLRQLAARVGRTPFYAYDRLKLTERVADLRRALPEELGLHYAMKANPMPALVGHLVGLVDGVDVASAGELAVALDAGADPEEISIAGPGKSEAELRQAVAARILVNIESVREVGLLAAISSELGLPARAAVRVNPDFELKSSGMSMGGGPKPFGVDAERVPELLSEIGGAGLAFEGFHLFAGSQNLRADAIVEAQRLSYELALRLAEHAPRPVRILNLGGGFGIPYFPGDKPLDIAPIGDNLRTICAEAAGTFPEARIVVELGRYLVGEAGVYVARVIDKKVSRGRTFLVTDGGLHHHLAASGNFGQVIRKNYPVAIGTAMNLDAGALASVVGPLCTPLDLLASEMPLGNGGVGDLVVVFQSGAYGATASPQRFLSHPPALEVLV
jgi:diaminopimelate decarboxylase